MEHHPAFSSIINIPFLTCPLQSLIEIHKDKGMPFKTLQLGNLNIFYLVWTLHFLLYFPIFHFYESIFIKISNTSPFILLLSCLYFDNESWTAHGFFPTLIAMLENFSFMDVQFL